MLIERAKSILSVLERHVDHRLSIALKKYEGKTDSASKKEVDKNIAYYELKNLLEEGAKYANQVQISTHIAKAVHPDIKVAKSSNLRLVHHDYRNLKEVGSHSLHAKDFQIDATGNGAVNKKVYEAYLLLNCTFEGESIFSLLSSGDSDAISALNDDTGLAESLSEKLVAIVEDKCPQPASDTRAKQVYWLVGDDPTMNEDFHILAPLYATSLAHAIYGEIQDVRFGEENKAARAARRERNYFDGVLRDFPDLAVQKLGGTKPQNISQLNSERGGTNYLLSSRPPQWTSRETRCPLHMDSVLERVYGAREGVRATLRQLLAFLETNPEPTMATRNRVESYVDTLIDELVQMARLFQSKLQPGWTLDERCELDRAEELWLDPLRAEQNERFREEWLWMDWPAEIGGRFARWLNAQLGDKGVSVGDAEFRHWKKELLTDEETEGWAQQLHRLRKAADAPTYIPTREGRQ